MTKLMQAASVIGVLGGLGLFLSSSCGGDAPATIADNANTGGSSGSVGGNGAPATGGGAGVSAADDASVGSGGSGVDTDAEIFVDGMVAIPDGAVTTGDSALDDDSGDPPLEDAGPPPTDGGVVVKTYGIYCYGPSDRLRKACTGPTTSCCYDSDTGVGTCSAAKCPTTVGTYTCDGSEDCAVGQVCCGAISTLPVLKGSPNHEYTTHCSASCGKGLVARDTAYVVVCKHATDCLATQTCLGPATNMPAGLGICTTARTL